MTRTAGPARRARSNPWRVMKDGETYVAVHEHRGGSLTFDRRFLTRAQANHYVKARKSEEHAGFAVGHLPGLGGPTQRSLFNPSTTYGVRWENQGWSVDAGMYKTRAGADRKATALRRSGHPHVAVFIVRRNIEAFVGDDGQVHPIRASAGYSTVIEREHKRLRVSGTRTAAATKRRASRTPSGGVRKPRVAGATAALHKRLGMHKTPHAAESGYRPTEKTALRRKASERLSAAEKRAFFK